jgi:predicted DNA-binding protein with PD1-like motif
VTFRIHRTEKVRHLVLRASDGDVLPDGLVEALRQEGVACGWLRASGVLADVALRAYGSETAGLGSPRLIAGPVQVVAAEGSVGIAAGAPSCSLRAVIARETDRGLETFAGEILSARVVALEVLVTAFDDLTLVRSLDEAAGVWMFDASSDGGLARRVSARPSALQPAPGWSAALHASASADRTPAQPRARTAPQTQSVPMPTRPARPVGVEVDGPVPEAGDVVDHFAFGRCDVLKSDGDRLHLRIHKDARIREIALEMLRVILLSEEDERPRRFKLERRI